MPEFIKQFRLITKWIIKSQGKNINKHGNKHGAIKNNPQRECDTKYTGKTRQVWKETLNET